MESRIESKLERWRQKIREITQIDRDRLRDRLKVREIEFYIMERWKGFLERANCLGAYFQIYKIS